MLNEKAIAWTGPEFWLDLTNAALGVVSIAFCALLVFVIFKELTGRKGARRLA